MTEEAHKPSYYLYLFERLQCDVKQPLSLVPGEGLRTRAKRSCVKANLSVPSAGSPDTHQ